MRVDGSGLVGMARRDVPHVFLRDDDEPKPEIQREGAAP
jgi:hypothetical protein